MTFDVAEANARFASATPEARLAFAIERWGAALLFTSSFGVQSAMLLHLWSKVARGLPIVFIDTGFSFPETLAYRDELVSRLGLTLQILSPDVANKDFVARYGDSIQKTDPDFCCGVNKVAPLAGLKTAAKAWVSGLRRDQSKVRSDVELFELDEHLVRVHPIADVTAEEVKRYFAKHALPDHPLVARRYLSVGCAPCTRASADLEDERAGRWAWSNKSECGLHSRARG